MSSLQPTSTTLAFGQNSCVSPCHCAVITQNISQHECDDLEIMYVALWTQFKNISLKAETISDFPT